MAYHNTLLFVLAVFIFTEAQGNFAADCDAKGKATTSLDFAVQLITSVKDSYPICPSESHPIDCEDILRHGQNKSGIYQVWPRSRAVKGSIEVYCDMDTDGGGWTVIQRRGNYSRSKDFFYQDWKSYKEGFGNIDKDFWLGNDYIFSLTNQRLCSVRFDLQDVEWNRRYALYDTFWIDDEKHQYMLHIAGFSGDAGDSMIPYHTDQKFSTKDRKYDNAETSCAEQYKGGWWYNKCHESNLNGLYHTDKHASNADGIHWVSWKRNRESLESTEIKIRSKDFRK